MRNSLLFEQDMDKNAHRSFLSREVNLTVQYEFFVLGCWAVSGEIRLMLKSSVDASLQSLLGQ